MSKTLRIAPSLIDDFEKCQKHFGVGEATLVNAGCKILQLMKHYIEDAPTSLSLHFIDKAAMSSESERRKFDAFKKARPFMLPKGTFSLEGSTKEIPFNIQDEKALEDILCLFGRSDDEQILNLAVYILIEIYKAENANKPRTPMFINKEKRIGDPLEITIS